ncbi:hypothetical protein DFJ73DRAFT_848282 [Zopfochytrium polystomum]|nr:hypothetical protein DFJ73DRAFT_848282 [Zopfochytrium polystomum]
MSGCVHVWARPIFHPSSLSAQPSFLTLLSLILFFFFSVLCRLCVGARVKARGEVQRKTDDQVNRPLRVCCNPHSRILALFVVN